MWKWLVQASGAPRWRPDFEQKKSPSNQNLPYMMLKTRFPFLYASTSLDTKTLTIALNFNFESYMTILCLAPQHVLRFFHFWRGFFLSLWNFAHYCVFLLNAPLSDRDEKKKKKKHLCSGLLLPGNLDPSSLSPGGPIVLLACGFRRWDNLLAWRELFVNLYELTSRIWYLREYNHFERTFMVY